MIRTQIGPGRVRFEVGIDGPDAVSGKLNGSDRGGRSDSFHLLLGWGWVFVFFCLLCLIFYNAF
jgi:hypothetical protein